MSDLEPTLQTPILEDPSITRLLLRRADGRRGGLLDRAGAVATSVSVVVPVGGAVAEPVVTGLAGWRSDRVRVEVLVMDHEADSGRTALREALSRSGRSWRMLQRPPGGRAAALAAAATAAEHEFVLVGTDGAASYDTIEAALSLMWAEGADVALVHAHRDDAVDPDDAIDPSATLSRWLGLRGAPAPGRQVLMRRWVARWLFNEITRAISPADEVADRARLLGIGIVEVASFASDAPLRGS